MLFWKRAIAAAFAALCVIGFGACLAAAYPVCTFESGLGQDAVAIGTSVPGLAFGTLSGADVVYADINSGNYSVTSDNGKVYEDGEYLVSGDVAALVLNLPDTARIDFTDRMASYVSIGYSSQFPLFLEAYDPAGMMLTSTVGEANTKSLGGTGLAYMTLSHPGMAYVLIHDAGGYWLMDDISTDALVPEPGSLAMLAAGVLGLAARRRRIG